MADPYTCEICKERLADTVTSVDGWKHVACEECAKRAADYMAGKLPSVVDD